MTMLYITHDLNLVRRFADDVAVMRGGRIVETGAAAEVFARPQHEYTKSWGAVITPATAEHLAGGTASDNVMWVRTHGDGSSEAPEKAIRQLVRGQGMMVTGRAAAVNLFTKQLNQVAVVVSAVLGLSLIIALSGLANTTDVAVLERTREIGMLRATGTCRSEIRRLIILGDKANPPYLDIRHIGG